MIGVVKIGSALFNQASQEKLNQLKTFIKSFKGKLVFVAGGGSGARQIIDCFRKFGLPEGFLDQLGIEGTQINAIGLARLVDGMYCRDFKQVEANLDKRPVTAGQIPGQSTDAVALQLASYLGADLVILTKDVGGVYTHDPKQNPGARVIHKLDYDELSKFVSEKTSAGSYGVIDPQAVQLIIQSKVPCYITGIDFDFESGTVIKEKP
ncbi:MAG: UMP kinase [Candidatus Altiarchaeota archaeon]|nr:UMP kinase [Candidatus Altiarchaeota archaeon]